MKIESKKESGLCECPAVETLQRLAKSPDGEDMADVAAHLFVCERCRRVFESILYPREGFSLTDEERNTICEFVHSRCTEYDPYRKLRAWVLMHPPIPRPVDTSVDDESYFRKAAAKESKRLKSTDSDVVFLTYASRCGRASGRVWRATLALPASPSDKTRMLLAVEDMEGRPAEGVFVVAGIRSTLSNGRGEIEYQGFVAGLKDPEVRLEYPDGIHSSGTLVLF